MVRIRAFSLVMSLPLLLAIAGVMWSVVADATDGLTGWFIIGFAILLQIVLGLAVACPRCGKSPYTIGPNWGPFEIVGKPFADRTCSRRGHQFIGPRRAAASSRAPDRSACLSVTGV